MLFRSMRGTVITAVLMLAIVSLPASAEEPSPVPEPGAFTARLALSCEAFAADPAPVVTLAATAGAPILVTLCAVPAGGFRWAGPGVADPSIVTARSWTWRVPADAPPGAPGTELFVLEATAPGETSLTFTTERPWDGGEPGPWRLTVAIAVSAASAAPGPSAEVERAAAAGASCCAVHVVNWGNPIHVVGRGASHSLPSGTGAWLDGSDPSAGGRGEILVTWMDRQQARLEFRRSADGAGVRWLDVTTGRILMERTFTVIGQEAYLWSRDEGHTIAATYVDGTGRLEIGRAHV